MKSYGKVMADLCHTILTYFWQKNNSEIEDLCWAGFSEFGLEHFFGNIFRTFSDLVQLVQLVQEYSETISRFSKHALIC